jgi:hypothetical protein
MRLPYRVRQAVYYLRADRQTPPVIPADALALLTEPMAHQFRILSPGEQRHLLRVYRYLKAHDAQADTTTAGLIHDVGKGCMKCRITVVDRGAHVLLSRFAPGAYRRFADMETAPVRLRGLHRLANHPARGALAAEQAGYNARVCRLIRDHEAGGDPGDPELRMLRIADATAGPEYECEGRA